VGYSYDDDRATDGWNAILRGCRWFLGEVGMKTNTYQMVRLAVEGDDTLSDADRKAILDFCQHPVSKPSPPEPRPAAERQKPKEQYLRPREAAAMLGVNSRTIQRWIQSGVLESSRICGCRRIPCSAIQKLCEADRAECHFPDHTDDGKSEGKQAKAS
jgi:excisionase family DNA binding protein